MDKKNFNSDIHEKITVGMENNEKVLRVNGVKMSAVSTDNKFTSSQDYHNLAHIPFSISKAIKNILLIGLGGGALASRMAIDYPDVNVTVCEIDSNIVDIAYSEFALPKLKNLEVKVCDGWEYIKNTNRKFDYIFVDAYFSLGVPKVFVTSEAVETYYNILVDDGVLGFNFVDKPDGENLLRLCKSGSVFFPQVKAFTTGNDCRKGRHNIAIFYIKKPIDNEQLEKNLSTVADKIVNVNGYKEFGKYEIKNLDYHKQSVFKFTNIEEEPILQI